METTRLANLEITGEKGSFFIPHVFFDATTGKCLMEGESYLENTWQFYNQLMQWLQAYASSQGPISFDFKLTYFNTSSSKGILELLQFLKQYEDQGGEVEINWYYSNADEDMLEEAEDFIEDTQIKINLIPY